MPGLFDNVIPEKKKQEAEGKPEGQPQDAEGAPKHLPTGTRIHEYGEEFKKRFGGSQR